jgi:drug/metabolite transporter (DMT)-like permease
MLFIVLFAMIPSFLWGLIPIVDKYAVDQMHIMSYILITSFFYLAISMLYFILKPEKMKSEIIKLDSKLLWVGILATIISFVAEVTYLHLLQSHDNLTALITALTYTSPFFTLILGYLILKEKITIQCAIGVLFIIAGAVIIAVCHKI